MLLSLFSKTATRPARRTARSRPGPGAASRRDRRAASTSASRF